MAVVAEGHLDIVAAAAGHTSAVADAFVDDLDHDASGPAAAGSSCHSVVAGTSSAVAVAGGQWEEIA